MSWEIPETELRFMTAWWGSVYAQLAIAIPEPLPASYLGYFYDLPGGLLGGPRDDAVELYGHICDHFGPALARGLLFEPPDSGRKDARYGPFYHQALSHAYALARWEETVGGLEPKRVIEWGGGYGSMARTIMTRYPDVDYTIVDLPLMLACDERYLAQCDLKANLVLPSESDRLECDFFVSLFALSECSEYAQDWCTRRWFGQHHLVVAEPEGTKADWFGSPERLRRGMIGIWPGDTAWLAMK